jgi:hypothetical protein
MKKTVDKIPFYRLGWNKKIYVVVFSDILRMNLKKIQNTKQNMFFFYL